MTTLASFKGFKLNNCINVHGRGYPSQTVANMLEKIGFLLAIFCTPDDYVCGGLRDYLDYLDNTGRCSKYFLSGIEKCHEALDLVSAYVATIGRGILGQEKWEKMAPSEKMASEHIHRIVLGSVEHTAHLVEWFGEKPKNPGSPLNIIVQKAMHMFKGTTLEQKKEIFYSSDPFYHPDMQRRFSPFEVPLNLFVEPNVFTDVDGKQIYTMFFSMRLIDADVVPRLKVRIFAPDIDGLIAHVCHIGVFLSDCRCPRSLLASKIEQACLFYILCDVWVSMNNLKYVTLTNEFMQRCRMNKLGVNCAYTVPPLLSRVVRRSTERREKRRLLEAGRVDDSRSGREEEEGGEGRGGGREVGERSDFLD